MTTVGDIVTQYLIEQGKNSQHGRDRLINIAISGLKELSYDVTGEPITEQLTLDSNYTAKVPTGLINVTGMFINVDGYGLLEIVETNKMSPRLVQNNGTTTDARTSVVDGGNGFPNTSGQILADNPGKFFQGGEFRGGIYRGVDPNPYKYNRNRETNRFEFSSNIQYPIVEYIGELGAIRGKHPVPSFAVDALMYWLRHAENRNKGISPREKQFNHQQWLAAKNLVLRRMSGTTPANMRQAFRSSYSLTTK